MNHQHNILQVTLVTPKGLLASKDSRAVTAPGNLGAFQVFPGHVPFLTKLDAGVMTFANEAGGEENYAVGPGVLEVESHNVVRALVERGIPASEINLPEVKAELSELEPKLEKWKGELDADHKILSAKIAWARAQVEAAS